MMAPVSSFLDFGGRWVVVTGASQGIGRACAEQLAAHGARLVLVGRNAATLESTRVTLPGEDHRTLVLDLSELERIGEGIHNVVNKIGRVYGLCHAAGEVATQPLSALAMEAVQQLIRINLLSGLELAKSLCRRDVMDPSGGSLVLMSSIYGLVGVPGETGYSAAKGAVAAAARAMAIELARRRIRVNTISPGFVRTPMTEAALGLLTPEQAQAIEHRHPLGVGTPADVARAAVFLLAPSTTWITGIDMVVDGGYSAQ